MRLHMYVSRKVTAKSHRPAGKGDTGKREIHSEKIIWRGCLRFPYARRPILKGASRTLSSVCSALLKSRLHLSMCLDGNI